jgi:hypothetical protein
MREKHRAQKKGETPGKSGKMKERETLKLLGYGERN